MRWKIRGLVLGGLLALLALLPGMLGLADEGAAQEAKPAEEVLLELINAHRAEYGLSALQPSEALRRPAAWMAEDMALKNYFGHRDSLGRDPFGRMSDLGYDYNTWKGENLAAGTRSAQETFEIWRDSPGHNANMLDANYVVVGIGRAYQQDSGYRWYWAAEFGGHDAQPARQGSQWALGLRLKLNLSW